MVWMNDKFQMNYDDRVTLMWLGEGRGRGMNEFRCWMCVVTYGDDDRVNIRASIDAIRIICRTFINITFIFIM
jgi:hypothetical protein